MKENREIWNRKYLQDKVFVKGGLFEYTTKWVWDIIEHHVKEDIRIKCIDIGCGDLSFWKYRLFHYRPCKNYIGIDISDFIIKENVKKFPNRQFLNLSSSDYVEGLSSLVVLCMDLLFHIPDNCVYVNTIINLCEYSKKWIILSNWHKEPEKYNTDYQTYRNFDYYQYIFEHYGFKLMTMHKVPINNIGAIYVYKKVDENEC